MLAADPGQLDRSCASCRPGKCFNKSTVIIAKSQHLPVLTCTRSDWWKITDALRQHFQNPNWTDYQALLEYGICPRSIITMSSIRLLELYGVCGGIGRIRTPDEFYSLPAKYVAAVSVINAAKAAIIKETNSGNH